MFMFTIRLSFIGYAYLRFLPNDHDETRVTHEGYRGRFENHLKRDFRPEKGRYKYLFSLNTPVSNGF